MSSSVYKLNSDHKSIVSPLVSRLCSAKFVDEPAEATREEFGGSDPQ